MTVHVVSIHCDDAILSLGAYLAHPDTTGAAVYTVLAGLPKPGVLTDYDRSCGFESSLTAMRARRKEDVGAMMVVGAAGRHFTFLDGQYRSHNGDEWYAEMVLWLHRTMSPEIHTFAPLGIGHPDHVLVARACRDAVPVGALVLYEELPYRVLHPEQVVDALEAVRAEGWTVDALPYPLPQGPREVKERAIACYKSQFPNGAVDPCLLVPERAWRITRGL